ncbi:TPA: SDR family NAD(P)-dependent oxidoreductase, partial [Enterococcus faecium]
MDVKGKNVFITGSTRGIGKAMALAFAKAGANIILNGRGEIPKEKIEEIEAFGVKCVGVSGDISDYEKAGQMIKEAEEKLGSIHVLVNNAGITNDKLVMRMDAEDFKKCLD